jgi:signal transduction histidine kinase
MLHYLVMGLSTQEIVLVVVSIYNLSIGLFVLLQQFQKLTNRLFFAATFGIFIWGIGLILLAQTQNFFFNTVMFYGFTLFIFGFVSFARIFPTRLYLLKKFYLIFIPLLFVPIAAPLKLIVKGATFVNGHPEPINGPLFPLFVLLSLFYFLAGFYFFARTYQTSSGVARVQINYLVFGLMVLLGSTVIFDMVLPIFGIFSLNFLGPTSSIVLTGITAYAIVRHQLMDIRVIVQRSIIYALLLGLTAVFYLSSVYLVGRLFNIATGTSTLLGGATTTLFGIFTIPFIERYFRKITDPIFFKDRYDYPKALHQLSKILHTSVRQADIVQGSSELLRTIFKTHHVLFRLGSDSEICPKPSQEAVMHAQILFEEKCIGVVELGEKRSGERYTREDHQLLETFAYQAAVAIEKARLYEKVEESSGKLEHLVEERTEEIKKLQEDQKQTMIDISHNLQTPLAIIRGELELLNELTADQEKVRVVKKSLDRVSQFIRQLLHVAKLDSSAFEVKKISVNLAALVQEQVEYFEVMAEEEGIEIITTVAPNVRVLGDRRLLQELLTNLVANAIRYRAQNVESKVLISVAETKKEIVLVVQDNGVGISEEVLPELFTRYASASRAGAKEESTGLGLAICKRIAERHDASISVASEVGKGTEITIIFQKR